MSNFVKSIIKLAKEYRASEQDVRFLRQFQRVASIRIAENNDAIVRRAVQHYAPAIIQFAQENNISIENYVFHHLKGTDTKHYIGTNAPQLKNKDVAKDVRFALMLNSNDEYDKSKVKNYIKKKHITIQYLQQLKGKVEMELDGCVILPKKFHDWLHHQIDNGAGVYTIKKTGENIDVSNRTLCYQLLNRYRFDSERLKELVNEDFDNSTLMSAIKSLKELISLSYGNQEQNKAKKCIQDAFFEIKNQMISNNIAK